MAKYSSRSTYLLKILPMLKDSFLITDYEDGNATKTVEFEKVLDLFIQAIVDGSNALSQNNKFRFVNTTVTIGGPGVELPNGNLYELEIINKLNINFQSINLEVLSDEIIIFKVNVVDYGTFKTHQRKYFFPNLMGKGDYSPLSNLINANDLEIAYIQREEIIATPEVIENSPNNVVFDLGDITGQDYLQYINEYQNTSLPNGYDLNNTSKIYYFRFIDNDVTYLYYFDSENSLNGFGYYGVDGDFIFQSGELILFYQSDVPNIPIPINSNSSLVPYVELNPERDFEIADLSRLLLPTLSGGSSYGIYGIPLDVFSLGNRLEVLTQFDENFTTVIVMPINVHVIFNGIDYNNDYIIIPKGTKAILINKGGNYWVMTYEVSETRKPFSLELTLEQGRNTGGTNILVDDADAIELENGSLLKKGTNDFGGNGGISQICSVGYEKNWQAGIDYVFDNSGFIRTATNCFNVVPNNTFDSSLRFKIDSRWILDDGTIYICTDATTGAAVWEIENSGSLDQDNIPKERVYSLSQIGATNFDSDIKNLLAAKIATQSITIAEKEIPLFEVNAELPIVGNVIDNSFSGSTLDADFTTNLTLGSEYTMSSGLNILSGNSAFGKYIQLEKTIAVTRWKQSLIFVVNSITSSSYGIALGLFSSNSTAMSVAKSSIIAQAFLHSDGSLKGKIRLYRAEDASTSFATSSVALSFSATDRLKLELTRIDNKFVVDFYNLTTSTSIQFEYNFDASITTVPLIPNTGKFKIYVFSGSYKIENYKYDNNGFLGGVAYLGDSISNSYVADIFTNGYQYKTTDNRRWNTFGGQADKSGDVLLALPQLTTENIPSRAVLFLGMNDYLQSVSTTTYKSNLNSIISALQAVGTEVFLITPSPTNLGDISAYVTAALEVATDNSLLSINAFTLLKASSGTGLNTIYNGDGVHPNSDGHQLIANTIKSTFLTLEPSVNVGRQVYILKNRGKGSLNDIVASNLFLLVDERAISIPTTATDLDALNRNGSNANSNVELGPYSLKAKSIIVNTLENNNYMILKSENMTAEHVAQFQDQDYIGIEDISNKGVPNGYVPLNADAKIDLQYILDNILGQVLYGGIVDATTGSATLTNNAKSKLNTSSSSITLTNNSTAITGYTSNEGIYYIVNTSGTFAGISFEVGDWLISIGSAWKKVDNTDAVVSFMGRIGPITLLSSDVLTALGFTPQASLGFTPENVSNKSTSTSLGTSDTLYPTQRATKTYADNLDDQLVTAQQALGSTVKSIGLGIRNFRDLTTSLALTDGQMRFIAVYLPKSQTITGVKWQQVTQGVYTADNENRIGLYTYSAGTMTLVASSADDGNLWKVASGAIGSKAFSTPYSANSGLYFIGILWNASATSTAPSLGSGANLALNSADFTNSAKIGSVYTAATIPASLAQSATSSQLGNLGLFLY